MGEFQHACRGTCSGWDSGYEEGQKDGRKDLIDEIRRYAIRVKPVWGNPFPYIVALINEIETDRKGRR